MDLNLKHDVRRVAAQFNLRGECLDACPYGSGHINDTYAVTINQAGTPVRYILQRINHAVFRQPAALMENVERVTAHLRRKLEAARADEISRPALTLVPSHDGLGWLQDATGNYWRCYLFIEKAKTYDGLPKIRRSISDDGGAKLSAVFSEADHTGNRHPFPHRSSGRRPLFQDSASGPQSGSGPGAVQNAGIVRAKRGYDE